MYKDVQNSNNVDKQMLNQLVNENVIRFQPKTKFKKGSFYCPFFMSALKIFNEVFNECSMKFPFQITFQKCLIIEYIINQ